MTRWRFAVVAVVFALLAISASSGVLAAVDRILALVALAAMFGDRKAAS